jgi:hypothetical protein
VPRGYNVFDERHGHIYTNYSKNHVTISDVIELGLLSAFSFCKKKTDDKDNYPTIRELYKYVVPLKRETTICAH